MTDDSRTPAETAFDHMIDLLQIAKGQGLTRDNLNDLWPEAMDTVYE